MKKQKIAGIILVVIGIVVFLFAIYAKNRVSEAKHNVQKSSGMFSDNPINKQISGAIEQKISSYDSPLMWAMVGGIVVTLLGVGTYFRAGRR